MSAPVVVVAATFTADPLVEPLQHWFRELALPHVVELGAYNQVFQQLLDPSSPLLARRSGHNIISIRWEDLVGSGSDTSIARELADAIEHSVGASGRGVVVALGPPDPNEEALHRELDRVLIEALAKTPQVRILTAAEVAERYPVERWFDREAHRFGHVPYTPEYFAALATSLARTLFSLTAAPYKVLAVDCDNTIWGGVVGEDGPEGVRVDGPFRAVQEMLVRQAESGRLVCLLSKNQEEDVFSVFDARPEMPLQRHHVVGHRINWLPKPNNVANLADELNLGLDSFIFVDDNPVECGAMRAAWPQVLTLQLPRDESDIPRFIEHVWALDVSAATAEDRKRAETYKQNAARRQLESSSASFDDFLARLKLEIDISAVEDQDVPRASQLTQRTNQFNASTKRRQEGEIRALMARDDAVCRATRLRDRFGDYGFVGLSIGVREGNDLVVDSFMLSCRALGRGVEHRMLAELGEVAAAWGLARVVVPYEKSARNEPVRDFLWRIGEGYIAGDTESARIELPTPYARELRYRPETSIEVPSSGQTQAAPSPERVRLNATLARIAETYREASDVIRALRSQTRPRPDLTEAYVAPKAGLEQKLADIWREVLRLDRVGARDRFNDLGGRSIQLVRVHGLLLTRLGVDVGITTLFEHPTIGELAAHLAAGDGDQRVDRVKKRAELQRRQVARFAQTRARSRAI